MDRRRKVVSVVHICFNQLFFQVRELRSRAVMLLLVMYLSSLIFPLREFAGLIGEKISPWLFPIFINDIVCSLVIFCIWCFLVCNAPFQNEAFLYYIGRVGKKVWIYGEILFLLVFSALYVICIQLGSMLLSIPHLILTMQWGRVLGTLAYTDAIWDYPMPFAFPVTMMSAFKPIEATVYSMLLVWLATFLIGMTITTINYITRTTHGLVIALFLVLFDITINNVMNYRWLRYSPISLTRITLISGIYTYLTPAWAIRFLAGCSCLLIIVLVCAVNMRKGLE